MITINENNGNKRDRRRWKNYIVAKNPADIKSCVPLFLAPIAEKIFICGKSIELMHFICPQHFLCTEMIRLPHLRMSYSKVEMRRQMVEWGEFQSLLQHQENDINLYWEKEEQTRVREKEELISSSLEQFHSQLEE
uniref:Uncharacterized protein n=1 Tax=Ciona savignyi TaxID=51511 RepID=H2Y949_CIOSA